MNDTLLKNTKGEVSSLFYYRMGEPFEQAGYYIIRIYELEAKVISDLNKEPTDIFLVVRRKTESACIDSALEFMEILQKKAA